MTEEQIQTETKRLLLAIVNSHTEYDSLEEQLYAIVKSGDESDESHRSKAKIREQMPFVADDFNEAICDAQTFCKQYFL